MENIKRRNPVKKKKPKKGKKKKKPIDDAAAELAAENEKKALVESLVAKTDLSEEEILAAHEEFYEKYPSGEITEKQFLQQSTESDNVSLISIMALTNIDRFGFGMSSSLLAPMGLYHEIK